MTQYIAFIKTYDAEGDQISREVKLLDRPQVKAIQRTYGSRTAMGEHVRSLANGGEVVIRIRFATTRDLVKFA